ncbi:hypothetical protein GCM10010466_58820 [Planomonospora alba]|uniref:Uncharacterized protein n=1 Tax=Planomonospora alba TaxID=161354 RepID=A0ABP6NWR4_9ACTN
MTAGPHYPTSGGSGGEGRRQGEEPISTRPPEQGEEQDVPQGGRPGKGPIGHPYGGRKDVPEDSEGLPGEWESHEVREQPRQRPSGTV